MPAYSPVLFTYTSIEHASLLSRLVTYTSIKHASLLSRLVTYTSIEHASLLSRLVTYTSIEHARLKLVLGAYRRALTDNRESLQPKVNYISMLFLFNTR